MLNDCGARCSSLPVPKSIIKMRQGTRIGYLSLDQYNVQVDCSNFRIVGPIWINEIVPIIEESWSNARESDDSEENASYFWSASSYIKPEKWQIYRERELNILEHITSNTHQ
jgi:hypothetical protein